MSQNSIQFETPFESLDLDILFVLIVCIYIILF